MLLVFNLLALTASLLDSVTVRNFSLLNHKKENVLQPEFDRRRLSDSSPTHTLTLQFNVAATHFEFEFRRSYHIFATDATIKISGHVCLYRRASVRL